MFAAIIVRGQITNSFILTLVIAYFSLTHLCQHCPVTEHMTKCQSDSSTYHKCSLAQICVTVKALQLKKNL